MEPVNNSPRNQPSTDLDPNQNLNPQGNALKYSWATPDDDQTTRIIEASQTILGVVSNRVSGVIGSFSAPILNVMHGTADALQSVQKTLSEVPGAALEILGQGASAVTEAASSTLVILSEGASTLSAVISYSTTPEPRDQSTTAEFLVGEDLFIGVPSKEERDKATAEEKLEEEKTPSTTEGIELTRSTEE